MDFKVIYDITQSSFTEWLFDATNLIIFVIIFFAVYLFFKRYQNETISKLFKFFIVPVIMIILFGIVRNFFAYQIYLNAKNTYINNSNIKTTEGYVTNVHLYSGRMRTQYFQIGKENFEIIDNMYNGGFNKVIQNGGPITQGLYVRLHYYEKFDKSKVICKVEIRE